MRLPAAVACVGLCALVTACSGGRPEPPSTGGGSNAAEIQISGDELLGWEQRASSDADLSGFRFFLYVDGNRENLREASCGLLSSIQIATCISRLPPLTPGPHSIALSTASASGSESSPSAAIRVVVVRSTQLLLTPQPGAVGATSRSAPAAGGAGLTVQTIATGLREPTDLAVLPDARVLVAERLGTIRLVVGGVPRTRPALALDDVSAEEGAGLLSITLDPAFDKTRFVYAVYTAVTGFRLARFREVAGTLGERVILLDGVAVAPRASATVRFGPDGKLYVALDDAGDAGAAGDLGTFNGKVLRLNPDGTVPADQAGLTPVFVPDVSSARALDWRPRTGSLWVATGRAEGSGMLNAVMDEGRAGRRGWIAARYVLPDGQVPSSAFFYRGGLMKEWVGDLLVALPNAGQLLRVRFDTAGGATIVATELVRVAGGRIQALGADADGLVYLANDDSLLTIGPARAITGL